MSTGARLDGRCQNATHRGRCPNPAVHLLRFCDDCWERTWRSEYHDAGCLVCGGPVTADAKIRVCTRTPACRSWRAQTFALTRKKTDITTILPDVRDEDGVLVVDSVAVARAMAGDPVNLSPTEARLVAARLPARFGWDPALWSGAAV